MTEHLGQSEASLPPTAQKALRVIRKHGPLSERELIIRIRPANPESVRSAVRILREDGFIQEGDVL